MALAVPKDCRLGASVSACARPAAADAAANPAANTAASANFVIANPTWGPLWYRQEIIRQGVPLQGKHQVFCGFLATYRPCSRRRVAAGLRLGVIIFQGSGCDVPFVQLGGFPFHFERAGSGEKLLFIGGTA